MKPTFENLMEDARAHNLDTAAAELGFSTRLAANLRALQQEAAEAGSFLDVFGNWLWRSAFGLVPLIAVLLGVAFMLNNGFSLPDGTENLVSYVTDVLPEPTLFVR